MRRSRKHKWSFIAIAVGIIILLSLLLPTEFWWFLFAAILISLGVWYLHSC